MQKPYSIQFDRAKFKDAVFYVCASCDPLTLGAVKLNKALYLADMIWFAIEGTPLTGATYRKRPFGPTTDVLLPVLRELENEGAIKIKDVDYFGYRKKTYIPLRKADTSRLSKNEVDWLNESISFVCLGNTAKTISEFTHNRAWECVESGEEIPYHNAFYFFPTIVSPETIEWGMKQAAQVEAERQKRPNMEYSSLRSFRERLEQAD